MINGNRGLVDILLLGLSMVTTIHSQYIINNDAQTCDREDEEIRLIFNSMITVGTLLWPIVWDLTIGLHELVANPRLLSAFFWVPLVNLCQMQFVTEVSTDTNYTAMAMFQQRSLADDTNQLISTAFAMGSLFFSSTKNYTGTHIIMYGLLITLAFVVPTLHVPADTRSAVLWRSGQFIILNYAIGFVIAGISTDLIHTLFPLKQHNKTAVTV